MGDALQRRAGENLTYVFLEMKLYSLLISKQNCNVIYPNSYPHISVRDLYISSSGLSILLKQKYMWTDPGNIYKSLTGHRHECGDWG